MLDIDHPQVGQNFLGWRVRQCGDDLLPGRDFLRLEMNLGADTLSFECHLPTRSGFDHRPLPVQRKSHFLSAFFCIESGIEHRFPAIYDLLMERRAMAAKGGVYTELEMDTLFRMLSLK